jgi:hypothetical protein
LELISALKSYRYKIKRLNCKFGTLQANKDLRLSPRPIIEGLLVLFCAIQLEIKPHLKAYVLFFYYKEKWLAQINEKAPRHVKKILVANKIDLP